MTHYDRAGRPITLDEWLALVADIEGKRVAAADVVTPTGRCLWVSTVWLGIDYSFGYGPPLIFETMVFEHGMADTSYGERYATEVQALAGHARAVHAAREGLLDPHDKKAEHG